MLLMFFTDAPRHCLPCGCAPTCIATCMYNPVSWDMRMLAKLAAPATLYFTFCLLHRCTLPITAPPRLREKTLREEVPWEVSEPEGCCCCRPCASGPQPPLTPSCGVRGSCRACKPCTNHGWCTICSMPMRLSGSTSKMSRRKASHAAETRPGGGCCKDHHHAHHWYVRSVT